MTYSVDNIGDRICDGREALQLHNALAAVAPIVGVSIRPKRIDFAPNASDEQKTAAQQILETFEPTPPPNWDGFLLQFRKSEIDRILKTTSDQAAYIRLNITFSDRNSNRCELIALYWADVIAGLPMKLDTVAIAELNQWATANYLPMRVGADGLIVCAI
jgi:hypothetical protein